MLDVRRLRLLREVQIRGTIAAAAEALNFTPSAVSQQLTQLEQETGVELLRRVGRRVQLTPQAEILAGHTETLLATLERAEADLAASLTTVSGTVRVAVFQSAMLALFPQTLSLMATSHPEVRVEIVQHEPETALADTWARDFDLVVAEQYPLHANAWHPGLDRRVLLHDAIRLAVPPGTSSFAPVHSLADAAEVPWVMEPRGAASRHFAEQACRLAGFEPDVRFQTADLQAQIRLVRSGNAVAFIPDLQWAGDDPTCRLVDLQTLPQRTIFTSARGASAERPAIAAVRATLEAVAREHVPAHAGPFTSPARDDAGQGP